MQTFSILGCGWLGLPLGARLAAEGHAVRGATTTPSKRAALEAAGLAAHVLRLTPEGVEGDDPESFFASAVLVLNVPPGRGTADVERRYPALVDAARRAAVAGGVRHVLFASSTSVYPDEDGVAVEADAGPGSRPSGEAVLQAERLLRAEPAFRTTVLRYGGLYGYDRQPARYLAGRADVPRPEGPVNLIHRDDAVGVALAVIEQGVWGEVFNAVADAHPTRRAYYTAAARRLGLTPPRFRDDAARGKEVSNQHLRTRLGYVFRHPDPLADVA